MPLDSYDAIIIGGGSNGMCLASYLARAGLSVAIFERRYECGSGVNTEELLMHGFYFNMHGQYMEFLDYMPFFHDFDLEKLGAKSVYPVNQAGITFADGRPPIILHRPDHLDLTLKSISQYSERDARTFVDMRRKVYEMRDLVAALLYSPPPMPGENELLPAHELIFELLGQIGFGRYEINRSTKAIIDELFETPELRTLLYRICVEWGSPVDWYGNGLYFLISAMFLNADWKLMVGGTHTLSHAMETACTRQGVDIRENCHVSKVLIRDGCAVGIGLADGREIEAKKLVASNADLHQTMLDMVGEENLSDHYKKRVNNFRVGPDQVLATLALALHEPPDYKSAKWDTEINRTFYTVVGFETPDDFLTYIRTAEMGGIPERPGAGTWVNSLFDPTYAPKGKHAMGGWFFFPTADCLTRSEWDEVQRTYIDRFLDMWIDYAPNMTRDKIIGQFMSTPQDIEDKLRMVKGDFSNGCMAVDQQFFNRPFPESSDYRTEIKNLYICGPYTHPGGGVNADCGYNAYKTIAQDHDLTKNLGADTARMY